MALLYSKYGTYLYVYHKLSNIRKASLTYRFTRDNQEKAGSIVSLAS